MSAQRLSRNEMELLGEVLSHRAPALLPLAKELGDGESVPVGTCKAMRDSVGEELMESGVDGTLGAVNERGELLDRLIDRLAELGRALER